MKRKIVIILVIILILLLIPFQWTGQKNDNSDTSRYKKSHSVYALLWQYSYSCEDFSSVEIKAYKVKRKITLFGFIVVYDKYDTNEVRVISSEKVSSEVSATQTEECDRDKMIVDSNDEPFAIINKITEVVSEYTYSDEYANDDVSARVEKIADILYGLEELGYIKPDGIWFSEKDAFVCCDTIDGLTLQFECAD